MSEGSRRRPTDTDKFNSGYDHIFGRTEVKTFDERMAEGVERSAKYYERHQDEPNVADPDGDDMLAGFCATCFAYDE
jgi:hypothetical protein